jgi:hypothetical protein
MAIQLHLVAESCTIRSSRSRQPFRKLLDTPLYAVWNGTVDPIAATHRTLKIRRELNLWYSLNKLSRNISFRYYHKIASYPVSTRGTFCGGKAACAWSWPLTSILCRGQRMSGAIPPLPQYAFMAWCSVKAQGQLYLYLYLYYHKRYQYMKSGNAESTNHMFPDVFIALNPLASLKTYEGVSKIFRTGRLERELQMVQLSATRCSCLAILWVSLVSSATITLCVASKQAIPKVSIYFVIDLVRKVLATTPSWNTSLEAVYRDALLAYLAHTNMNMMILWVQWLYNTDTDS